jgi:hypothetical protein
MKKQAGQNWQIRLIKRVRNNRQRIQQRSIKQHVQFADWITKYHITKQKNNDWRWKLKT